MTDQPTKPECEWQYDTGQAGLCRMCGADIGLGDTQPPECFRNRREPAMAAKDFQSGLSIDREWCIEAAKREGDSEVGAGALAADPIPQTYAEAELRRWCMETALGWPADAAEKDPIKRAELILAWVRGGAQG